MRLLFYLGNNSITIQKYNNRKEEDAGHKTGGGKDDGDQDSRKEKSL